MICVEDIKVPEVFQKGEIIKISGNKLSPKFAPEREHEIKHRLAEISKMKKIINFSPAHDLDAGLKLTMNWYRENLVKI